ncbi:hypothetical protein KY284_027743 [Solanum tuberosum]|nr:hypothetical protein KY284_027743 [Solanum tuberosum]
MLFQDGFYSDNSKMVSWGGRVIEFGPPPKYIGGHVTEFLDVDVDKMSYFELRDYINELGYTVDCNFFIKWDGLLVLVDNDKAPLELEFVPNVSGSGVGERSFNEASNPNNQPPTSTFPSIPTTVPSETFSTLFENQSTTVPPPSPSIVPSSSTVPHSSTVPPPSPSTVPPPSSIPSSDPIIDNDPTDDEVEDESTSEGDTNEDIEVDSDVHQEYIDIRASKRHFKRSQRRSRGTNSDQINVDEKGLDIGDEAPRFEIDDETGWGDGEEVDQVVHKPVRRKKIPNRVVFDATSEKIVWELGLDIIRNELDINVVRTTMRRARTRVLQEIMGDHIVEYGQLLVAVCRDGNNQMLPIAWAVVEVENQFTWTWFLELVKNDLDLGEGINYPSLLICKRD